MKVHRIFFLVLLLSATQPLLSIHQQKQGVKKAKNNKKKRNKPKEHTNLFIGIGVFSTVGLAGAIYLYLCKSSNVDNSSRYVGSNSYVGSKFRFQYKKETSPSYGELIEVLQPGENQPISFENFFKMLSKKEGALDFARFLKDRAESEEFPNGYLLRFPGLSYKAEKGHFQQSCKFLLRSRTKSFNKANPKCAFNQYFEDGKGMCVTFIGGGDNDQNRDLVLICPNASHDLVNQEACGDIASFVKVHGGDEVGTALFEQAGKLLCFYQKNGNLDDTSSVIKKHNKKLRKDLAYVFFSTSGLGKPWLHLRLDYYPQYYREDEKHSHFNYIAFSSVHNQASKSDYT